MTTMKRALVAEMKSRRGNDTLICFRNGDNFEAYQEDAKIIAETNSLKTFIEDELETVKFPASDIEIYSNRLLDAGLSVCISEMRDESGNFTVNITQDANEQNYTNNQ